MRLTLTSQTGEINTQEARDYAYACKYAYNQAVMPNKTIYVRDSELKMWDEAQNKLGQSISSVFSDFLKSEYLKDRLEVTTRLSEIQALNALLEDLNSDLNLDLELHPRWRYPILEQASLNHGFKLHRKYSDPHRIMSVIVSPWDFEEKTGRPKALIKFLIMDAVKGFWKGESSVQHVCVDTTVGVSEKLWVMANDLREQLNGLITNFEGRQMSFEELNKQFKNIQPRAVALAQEMVLYDPRLIPYGLSYDSPDIPAVVIAGQSITPPKALSVLRKISRTISELLENLKQ